MSVSFESLDEVKRGLAGYARVIAAEPETLVAVGGLAPLAAAILRLAEEVEALRSRVEAAPEESPFVLDAVV